VKVGCIKVEEPADVEETIEEFLEANPAIGEDGANSGEIVAVIHGEKIQFDAKKSLSWDVTVH